MKTEHLRIKAEGHVVIRDVDTQETLVDQHNDIHLENFGEALALALAGYKSGWINEMWFGSGGSTTLTTGVIDYKTPNVDVGRNEADLWGGSLPTYAKVVNQNDLGRFTDDPTRTNIKTVHKPGELYSDIVVTCTLGYGEPTGQMTFDNASTTDAEYIFDEIALKTYDSDTEKKRLLTHIIFHPVQKALNRSIEIIYTIRITMVP